MATVAATASGPVKVSSQDMESAEEPMSAKNPINMGFRAARPPSIMFRGAGCYGVVPRGQLRRVMVGASLLLYA